MDPKRYRVRDRTEADIEAESRVLRAIDPESGASAEELRRFQRMFDPVAAGDGPKLYWHGRVVEERGTGEVVAWGRIFHDIAAYVPDHYWLLVHVVPDHRHRGVGGAIYGELEEIARSRGASALLAGARVEDPDGMRFLEAQGFIERRRTQRRRLDLSGPVPSVVHADPARWAAQGIQFTTAQEEGPEDPAVRRHIYAVTSEAEVDVPRMGPARSLSFEQFEVLTFDHPGYLPDAIFLARLGDRYVAMSSLERRPTQPDTLEVGFTATVRDQRGRGLATELKLRAVDYARARGYRFIETGNDTTNRPIVAINERLGFRAYSTRVEAEKRLGPGT